MRLRPRLNFGGVIERLIILVHCMSAIGSFCRAFRPPRLDHLSTNIRPGLFRRPHGVASTFYHISLSSAPSSSSVTRMADHTTTTTSSSSPPIVVVIAGPTATGKSDVAARLCAGGVGGMIVSADSVQAYRGVQIGANKPTRTELEETPHILIDVADHTENYNAASWRRDALFSIRSLLDPGGREGATERQDDASDGGTTTGGFDTGTPIGSERRQIEIQQTIRKGRIIKGYGDDQPLLPVVCGGTMMYLQWLVHGQPDAMRPTSRAMDESSEIIRKYQDDVGTGYQDAVDYVSSFGKVFADRTKTFCGEDWYRLRRTLEVALTVRQTTKEKHDNDDRRGDSQGADGSTRRVDEERLAEQLYTGQRQGGLASLGYDVRCFFLCPDDRMGHASVVDERCEQMIIRGLIGETAELSSSGRLPEMAERAIGYRQTLDYLKNRLQEDDNGVAESEDGAFDFYLKSFTTATRQYAKTQMAWFRKDGEFMFVPVPLNLGKTDRVDSAVKAIQRLCRLSRSEYERELVGEDSVSSECKRKNAEQGKTMKFYQFERHILKPDSAELETVLDEAVVLRERFQGRKRKIEELGKTHASPS